MIDATNFARPHISGRFVFRFSVNSPEALAGQLRDFADKVEKGEVLVQKVQTGQTAKLDEYNMQGLFIEFATREEIEAARNPPKRIIDL